MSILFWILIMLITVLNAVDIYTTKIGLERGLREENAWMAGVINRFGINGLIAVKGIAVALVINLAIWVLPTDAAVWMLVVLSLFYAVIVWRNWLLIKE